MKLVIGLGNPGEVYRSTRHNIGYVIIDHLAQQFGIALTAQHLNSLTGQGTINGHEIILAKPGTFMNTSGTVVRELVNFYCLRTEDLIIIHDDIDLEFGRIKIKTAGGSGGHRGIESVCLALLTDSFIRLRMGIGRPPKHLMAREFVLQPFTDEEQKKLMQIKESATDCLKIILNKGVAAAMNIFHRSQKIVVL